MPQTMKSYALCFHQPIGEATMPSPERMEEIMTDVYAIREELRAAGAWVFGGGLHGPDAATVLKLEGDELLTIDGPFVEGKEHIGGITVIQAPDLDSALEWGRRYARATGLPIEVRPFVEGAA